jgi:gliding motility-associated-like protein
MNKLLNKIPLIKIAFNVILLFIVSIQAVKAQIEVSVPFNDGFIGLVGNNSQHATNVQRFATLTIAKASFVQTTNSGRFEAQGNDILGTLRLQLNNGSKIDIPGALVWRVNTGNKNVLLGFLANASVSLNLSAYGGPNYSIQGGTATGKSNFGFKLNGETYTLPNTGGSLNGNAAQPSIGDLNDYLDARPRVISPNPTNFALSTANQDPGDFSLANFNASDILLASVGLVNPPTGANFSFGTTTGLTRSTGYNSWTGLTRISFTGTQANINTALASLSVSTGTGAGDIKISVSAAVNESGYFFNPINGHYYKPVSGAVSYSSAKTAAATQTYKGQQGYLVTITSAVEQDFVNLNTTQSNIWIALSDLDSEGTWYIDAGPEEGRIIWKTSVSGITNSTTSSYSSAGSAQGGYYTNWDSSEPNNSYGSTGEDHAVTKWNNGTKWNDLAATNTSSIGGYLIEFGTWNDPDDNAFLDYYAASTTYVANCTVNQAPAAPTLVKEGTNTGAGKVELVVSVPTGITVDWYSSATGGSILSGGQGVTTFTTPVISSTTTFYAQSRNISAGCLNLTRTAVVATIVPCSTTLPDVNFKLSPPDITTSAIQGQAATRTENFNSGSPGIIPNTGTFSIGTYQTVNPGNIKKIASDVWGGSGSQYMGIYKTNNQDAFLNITLIDPSRYVGFWWGAGDAANTVTIYGTCGGNEIELAKFTAQTVLNLLSGTSVIAVDGNSYQSSLYKRSNAANESFAYINLELSDPSIYFTRIVFGGGGFEVDNITTGTGYGAASFTVPSAPTITSISTGNGSATINFTAPTSDGGTPITNYEYTTDGGTTWTAFSPATTSSPVTITGLVNGTNYPFQLRALNVIGPGPASNTISKTIDSGLDSDGDGITDINDPDDDNDGILDYLEQDCSASTAVSDSLTPSTFYFVQWNSFENGVLSGVINVPGNPVNVTVTNTSNSILLQNDNPFGGISNWAPQPTGSASLSTFRSSTLGEHKFVFDQPVNNPRFFINSLNRTLDLSLPGKILKSNGFFTGSPVGTTTQVLVGNEGTGTISFSGNVTEISFTGREYEFYCNFSLGISNVSDFSTCVDIDTDGDGIPDRLDLDSDGDGVTDAQELADGTSPTDLCSFVLVNQTLPPSATWETTDCDGDGFDNKTEVDRGSDPLLANAAPTNISLSTNNVNENVPANTTIGTLSSTDEDASNTFTYTLVSGTGSTDNAAFNISGDNLRITASPDFETKNSYSIRVRTTDQGGLFFEKEFTITVNDLNEAPTNLALSTNSVNENVAANTTVGTLSSTDEDASNTFTYTLVSGTGSTDNAAFNISGNNLRITASPDFEAKNSYSIRVRTSDQGGLSFEKAFAVTVVDLNEAPTDIALSVAVIYEKNAIGAVIGNLSSTDQDAGDKHTYSLVSGDVAAFRISGNQLLANVVYTHATKNTYDIVVKSTDAGGLSVNKTIRITILQSPILLGSANLPRNNQSSAVGQNVTISKGYSANLNLSGSNIVKYAWSPSTGLSATNISNPIANPTQTTTYTVRVTNAQGVSTDVYITVTVLEDYNVTPNNVLSPDGDGVNDFWTIENLSAYPNNEVKIFDKAGRIIYQVKNYQNDWNGHLNGEVLHEGAYYYIINLGPGTRPKVGYITLFSNK